MSWQTIDRKEAVFDADGDCVLTPAVQEKIRSFFPRYDTKRAALLPALHLVQETLGFVSWKAMKEVADLLEIRSSDVFDVISFYTHFWTKPRGEKVVTVCRSITCELLGGREVLEAVEKELGVREHQTTPDGKYSIAVEECLAGCDHAPCLLINEKLHKRVKPEQVSVLLADANNAVLDMERSLLFDPPAEMAEDAGAGGNGSLVADDADDADAIGITSDVAEMKEAD